MAKVVNSLGCNQRWNATGYNKFSPLNYPSVALPIYFTADTNLVITFNPTDNVTLPTQNRKTVMIAEEEYKVP